MTTGTKPPRSSPPQEAATREPNIAVLRRHGIKTLFHFTDAANLPSIRESGLLSASTLSSRKINAVLNSDELSRKLDKAMGLENYVRLSFNAKNPMQYVSLKEKRVSQMVMLQVKLEVVSRPGVMFSDCNAVRQDAVRSNSPKIVHFNVVKAKDQFAVPPEMKCFYQAEVLVPSPVPPTLSFSGKLLQHQGPCRATLLWSCYADYRTERSTLSQLPARSSENKFPLSPV
jgi:hypothetical protein